MQETYHIQFWSFIWKEWKTSYRAKGFDDAIEVFNREKANFRSDYSLRVCVFDAPRVIREGKGDKS